MRVRQQSKRDVAAEMHERYIWASRGEEGRLVGELLGLTGYHGNHAKAPLKNGPPAGGVGPDLRRAGRPVEYGLYAGCFVTGPGELVLGAESAAALFRILVSMLCDSGACAIIPPRRSWCDPPNMIGEPLRCQRR